MATVLVVDDEPDVRLVARVVLTSAGYDVDEAASGEEALSQVADAGPDVVLLDVRMPGLSGWDVLARLRADPDVSDLPVVVFTADHAAMAEAPRKLEHHEHFLAKPFEPDELLRTIHLALA